MSRRVITDEIWIQIQQTMQFYGCYRSRNSKNIMEAILWKPRTGAPWRVFLKIFAHGKLLTTDLIVGLVKAFGRIFFKITRRIG